jgi:hypothetical protein
MLQDSRTGGLLGGRIEFKLGYEGALAMSGTTVFIFSAFSDETAPA